MLNTIVWLIMGGLIGWIASMLMSTNAKQSTLSNIIVGVIGAFLAGLVLTPLFGVGTINQNSFSLSALLSSFLGAIILLGIVNLFRRGATDAQAVNTSYEGTVEGKQATAQHQCPKCGGYKVQHSNHDAMMTLHTILTLVTMGFWILIMAVYRAFNPYTARGTELKCQMCGYRWIYQGRQVANSLKIVEQGVKTTGSKVQQEGLKIYAILMLVGIVVGVLGASAGSDALFGGGFIVAILFGGSLILATLFGRR